ncbi:MAG: hypothetical protein N2050_11875 [Flavobacteriales bacterium]|nr:hypothetical protein [Flavobacteriales bacterium]MCX7651234.1 hypothetical protein [Flavobacteriales bacterium]MDW8431487.1 hypothetical protein [Flavobacteriales bacterium]
METPNQNPPENVAAHIISPEERASRITAFQRLIFSENIPENLRSAFLSEGVPLRHFHISKDILAFIIQLENVESIAFELGLDISGDPSRPGVDLIISGLDDQGRVVTAFFDKLKRCPPHCNR